MYSLRLRWTLALRFVCVMNKQKDLCSWWGSIDIDLWADLILYRFPRVRYIVPSDCNQKKINKRQARTQNDLSHCFLFNPPGVATLLWRISRQSDERMKNIEFHSLLLYQPKFHISLTEKHLSFSFTIYIERIKKEQKLKGNSFIVVAFVLRFHWTDFSTSLSFHRNIHSHRRFNLLNNNRGHCLTWVHM